MVSAVEAEIAGIFYNAQTAITFRTILEALNHTQPSTPIKTDNTTTTGFIHNNVHQKRSKSWDMRYFWLGDRKTQNRLEFYWQPGHHSYADYFAKHHPTIERELVL